MRVIYTDLDGTMLGPGGSLFRTAGGEFTMAGAEALRLCQENGIELCFVSGRSVRLLREDSRLTGVSSFIAEAGCVVVRDGGRQVRTICEPYGEGGATSVFAEISASGAPDLLFERFGDAFSYHAPWHRDHMYSHLMRGEIDVGEADHLLAEAGLGDLKVVDNGVIEDRGYGMPVNELHAYHILPRCAGKGAAIEADLEMAGYNREQAVACGDAISDLDMARSVSRLFLVANTPTGSASFRERLSGFENVVMLGEPMVEGFLEAVRRVV